jgi:hypothetical protein
MVLRALIGVGFVLSFVGSGVASTTQGTTNDLAGQSHVAFRTRLARAETDRHHNRLHRARHASTRSPEVKAIAGLNQQLRDLRKEVVAVEQLRAELRAFKDQMSGGTAKLSLWGGVPLGLAPLMPAPNSLTKLNLLATMPDLRYSGLPEAPAKIPADPITGSLPTAIKEELPAPAPSKSAVEEAKTYLIKTATPGYTMTRQGVSVAIGRLHPGFVVKLAEAVKEARDAGMYDAGLYSAYRPPAFRIGGFKDKFNSLHSYGLAVDVTGIGSAGSSLARLWSKIVTAVGLFLPYGPRNHREFNHTQFVSTKMATSRLRMTITTEGPKDLRRMWLASGTDAYVDEALAVQPVELAGAPSGTKLDGGEVIGDASVAATAVPPVKTRAPRRRGSSRGKSAANRSGNGRAAPAAKRARKTKAKSEEAVPPARARRKRGE